MKNNFQPQILMMSDEGGEGAGGGAPAGEGGDTSADTSTDTGRTTIDVEGALMPDMSATPDTNTEGTQADTALSQKPVGEEKAFLDSVPDNYKKMVEAKGFDSLDSVLKSYSEMEKLSGAKGPAKPGEDATEEHVAKWNEHIGVPREASQYEFAEAPEILKDAGFDERTKAAQAKMHEFGIPKEAGEKLVNWWNEQMANEAQALQDGRTTQFQEFDKQLRGEWGDKHDKNIAIGKAAMQSALTNSGLNAEDLAEALNKLDDTLGFPAVAKMMKFFGEKTGEDQFIGDTGERGLGKTKVEIQARIDQLEADPAYLNKADKRHQIVNSEVTKLYEELVRAGG